MMPHLGVLSTVDPRAAWQIFEKDCLVHLGTVVAPKGQSREGTEVLEIKLDMPDGTIIHENMRYGDIKKISLDVGETANIEAHPKRGMDMGEGPNKTVEGTVHGGEVGVIIDTRGRPVSLPESADERMNRILEWNKILELYDY
jgi:hypothetical protein